MKSKVVQENKQLWELSIGDRFYIPTDKDKKCITVLSPAKWSSSGSSLINCSDGKQRRKWTSVIKVSHIEIIEKMSIAKKVLIDELNEQAHPEKVEDVIFWALDHYSKSKPEGTWGRTIAFAIKERILEEEKNLCSK